MTSPSQLSWWHIKSCLLILQDVLLGVSPVFLCHHIPFARHCYFKHETVPFCLLTRRLQGTKNRFTAANVARHCRAKLRKLQLGLSSFRPPLNAAQLALCNNRASIPGGWRQTECTSFFLQWQPQTREGNSTWQLLTVTSSKHRLALIYNLLLVLLKVGGGGDCEDRKWKKQVRISSLLFRGCLQCARGFSFFSSLFPPFSCVPPTRSFSFQPSRRSGRPERRFCLSTSLFLGCKSTPAASFFPASVWVLVRRNSLTLLLSCSSIFSAASQAGREGWRKEAFLRCLVS